jgi:hypothetical protein
MREAPDGAPVELYAGKGYRTALSSRYITWLNKTAAELEKAWDAGDTAQEVYAALPWEGETHNERFGDTKWTAYTLNEDEVRLGVTLNPKGRLTVDYREFYTRH